MTARPVVTLYRKAGCGLCDQAAGLLVSLSLRMDFAVVDVDIESDPALDQRYRWAIPVVVVGSEEIARAPIRFASLEAALLAALAPPSA